MNEQVTALVLNAIGVVISTIIVAIGFLLKRSITDKLDGIDVHLQKIDESVICMKVEMLKEYVRKDEMTQNTASHKEIWEEINAIKVDMAKLDKAG